MSKHGVLANLKLVIQRVVVMTGCFLFAVYCYANVYYREYLTGVVGELYNLLQVVCEPPSLAFEVGWPEVSRGFQAFFSVTVLDQGHYTMTTFLKFLWPDGTYVSTHPREMAGANLGFVWVCKVGFQSLGRTENLSEVVSRSLTGSVEDR